MSLRVFLISLIFIFAIQYSYGFQKDYFYEIKGRVIDDYSKPVVGATVRIKSPEFNDGCIIYTESTDNKGNFTIKKQLSEPVSEWTLFTVDYSPLPENTNDLLSIGDILDKEYFSAFGGHKIIAVENRVTDLGDVRLQYRQYPIQIQLLDSEGRPLIEESKNGEYGFNPWWIVRDPRGDIISEGGNAYVHFRFSESAVMNALPKGEWRLDVSDDNGSGFKTSQIITVEPSENVQKITLKLGKSTLKFEGRKKKFPYTPKVARQKIEEMGFAFTQESFEKRVLNGNHKAVELFLNAGMNPNILTKNNTFINVSISRPQVLKVLLEAGANVNSKGENETTPLLYAAGWSIIPIETVKMLLDAGADVTAKNDEGKDALFLSQINDDRPEVTQLLKKYLAQKK